MSDFQNQLKTLRERNRMSQDELAKQLHMTRQAISNYERGKTLPDIYTIQKIAEIFDISVDELMNVQFQKKPYQKYSFLLYIALWIVFIGYSFYAQFSIDKVLIPIVIMFMTSTIYFAFGFAVRNDDYSMIAGYNPRYQYHYPTLRKMLTTLIFTIVSEGLGTMIFILIFDYMKIGQDRDSFLMIMFIVAFVASILLLNLRYKDKLLVKVDQKQRNKGKFLSITSLLMIGLSAFTMIGCFTYFGIRNNTPEAMQTLIIFIPNVIVESSAIVYESQSQKETISHFYYIAMGVSFVLNIALIGLCLFGLSS